MTAEKTEKTNLGRIGLAGAIVTGVFASACCIGPLVMVFLGISSAGALVAFEPYRPILMALTILFLVAAGYLTYRKPRVTECRDGVCNSSKRLPKVLLWVGVLFTLGMLFFPQLILMFLD